MVLLVFLLLLTLWLFFLLFCCDQCVLWCILCFIAIKYVVVLSGFLIFCLQWFLAFLGLHSSCWLFLVVFCCSQCLVVLAGGFGSYGCFGICLVIAAAFGCCCIFVFSSETTNQLPSDYRATTELYRSTTGRPFCTKKRAQTNSTKKCQQLPTTPKHPKQQHKATKTTNNHKKHPKLQNH